MGLIFARILWFIPHSDQGTFASVCLRITRMYLIDLKSLISVLYAANSKSGDILYKAQSQDEDALVHAAVQLHMVFVNRNANILGKHHLLLAVTEGMILTMLLMM